MPITRMGTRTNNIKIDKGKKNVRNWIHVNAVQIRLYFHMTGWWAFSDNVVNIQAPRKANTSWKLRQSQRLENNFTSYSLELTRY
jgi:hypothetical protein